MRFSDGDWQGNFGYWQSGFIHANLLAIGYHAWQGFLQSGRGLTSCDIDAKITSSASISTDLVPFQIQFIPQGQIITHMEERGLERDEILNFLQVINTYVPQREVIVLLAVNHRVEVNFLQNLAITPPECHAQVCKRWEEFQLCP